MYLSYDRYVEFGGSVKEPLKFELECREAQRFVDRVTLGRVKADFEISDYVVDYKDDLEMLVFKLMELNKANDVSVQRVSSESNQGMSRGYAIASAFEVVQKSACIVNEFLTGYVDHKGVRLLFRG